MKYRVGICQFQPQLLVPDLNRLRLNKILSGLPADLLVLPELTVSGYVFQNREEVEKVAEDARQGATAILFRQLAKINNTSYVLGFAERQDNKIYNSAMLVNPDGQIHLYRKTHLFLDEKNWFTPGDSGLQVFTAKDGVKVGLMICFDWIFPEAARTLALKGAQIIAHPANLVLPWCQKAMLIRSLENRVFTLTANRIGHERNGDRELSFTGLSQITGTRGEIIKRLGNRGEKVFITEIDPEEALDKNVTLRNDILQDRRPEFYL